MIKTIELLPATILRKVPQADEPLPNGSIIHWTEIYSTQLPYRKICVPVTCGHPLGNVECRGKRDVRVVRGIIGPDPLSAASLAVDGCTYTGLCKKCLQRQNRPEEKLSSGSVLLWPDIGKDGLPIICGKCGKRWNLKNGHAGYKGPGHCRDCTHRRTGDEVHPSGTIVHWDRRHPKENTLIAITCHQCKNVDGTERYIWHAEVSDANWSGLCRGCSSQRPPHNKRLSDEQLELSKSVIHWGERDPAGPEKVAVSCGLCLRSGKVTKRFMHMSAYRHWKAKKRAGHCREHYTDPDALVLLLQGSAQDVNSYVNKEEVLQLIEAVKAVAAVWAQVKGGAGSVEHRIKKIDLLAIGSELGVLLDPYDDVKSRNRVSRKLVSLGVYKLYPTAHGGCPAFIKAVVDAIAHHASPEEVAKNLLSQR